MSEHTPLTEAAVEVLHDAGWYGRADLTAAQLDGIVNTLADAGLLAARTSTATADTDQDRERLINGLVKQHRVDGAATADTGLRERVEAAREQIRRQMIDTVFTDDRDTYADGYGNGLLHALDLLRPALDATAAPTTDTGARDE